LVMDSTVNIPFSNWVMFDPSRRGPPPGNAKREFLGDGPFAPSRGFRAVGRDSSLSFANS
jgi:hypothetical protein